MARDTGWGLLSAAVLAPAAFITSVVLARWLEPAAHGQVQAALSLLVVLGYVVQGGWVAAVVVRIRRGAPADQVLTHALGTVGLQTVAAVGLGVALWSVLRDRLLVGAPDAMVAWVLVILPLGLWLQTLGGVARGLGRFSTWTAAQALHQVGRCTGLVAVAVCVPADPVVAMAVIGVAWALAVGALAVAVGRQTGLARGFDRAEWSASAAFGARSWLHTLTGQLHERADLFLLAWLLGDPAEVAVYAVAVGVGNRIRTVPIAVASAVYPQVAEATEAQGAALAAQATRHTVVWVVAALVGVALVAPALLPLFFGATYAASVAPLWVLLPATGLASITLVLGRWFQAVDRQGVNVASQGVSVGLNVGLNLWLIPRYGALGAAWATLASYALQAGWVWVAFMRVSGCRVRQTLWVTGDDLRDIRSGVWRLLGRAWSGDTP